MSEFNADFTKSKKKDSFGSSVPPEGWHRAIITQAEFKTSASGVDYINMCFDLEGFNSKCFFNCFVNGKDNNDGLYTMLHALRVEIENEKYKLDTADFLNKNLDIKVVHKKEISQKDGNEYTNLNLRGVDIYGAHVGDTPGNESGTLAPATTDPASPPTEEENKIKNPPKDPSWE